MPTPGYRLTTVLELSDFTMPAECTVDRLQWNFIRFTNKNFKGGLTGRLGLTSLSTLTRTYLL